MKITSLLALLTSAALMGCPEARGAEPLPGIPAGTRLVELTPTQREQFCDYYRDSLGAVSPGDGPTCTNGEQYTWSGMEDCMQSYETLPADCPTLVQTDVNYLNNIQDRCHEPGFDPNNYSGRRGCDGP
jgi:hypothetical protein